MYKYKGAEMGLEGIIGVPARDLTDEEFAEYNAKQNLLFPDQPNSLKNCGLYEHISEHVVAAPTQVRRGISTKESSDE